jgi:hypothetical protein
LIEIEVPETPPRFSSNVPVRQLRQRRIAEVDVRQRT